jgi:hypothetical protein
VWFALIDLLSNDAKRSHAVDNEKITISKQKLMQKTFCPELKFLARNSNRNTVLLHMTFGKYFLFTNSLEIVVQALACGVQASLRPHFAAITVLWHPGQAWQKRVSIHATKELRPRSDSSQGISC